jgi:hypothetical protein
VGNSAFRRIWISEDLRLYRVQEGDVCDILMVLLKFDLASKARI